MSIDRNAVISDMSRIAPESNENGLIPGFNVMVNRAPAALWNNFADLITNTVDPSLRESAEYLLFNAAQECGYHTGFGIITSPEWNSIVAPMIENVPEDVLHGAYAVFTAWGWANSEIVELIPGERMVVRAYDYYESDVVERGASKNKAAYMIQGVSAAFMDLAYGQPYPNGLRTFKCEQTKGIECGDAYGEFVVTRA